MSAHIDRLIRLDDGQRILSQAECDNIARRVKGFAEGGGDTGVWITSWWGGELRWGRNRVSLAGDQRNIGVGVTRMIRRAPGGAWTNQLDDLSLEAVVRAAERSARFLNPDYQDLEKPRPPVAYETPTIWSEATYAESAPEREQAARALIDPAEAEAMLSAGYLEVRADTRAHYPTDGPAVYAASTNAQCSMTVRDEKGTGSGWAGLSSYDWAKIDSKALARQALEKAIASRNPVSLEPGRYTVVLEPQAVHDLVRWIVQPWISEALDRQQTEKGGGGPFGAGYDNALALGRSKLGLKVVDERITISHDPMDPLLGVVPFDGRDEPYMPVKWIDHGVLTALSDGREYALQSRNDNLGTPNSGSYRMSGGQTTVDEMIRTTKRGLLVTRLWGTQLLDKNSLLLTGLTRDGLWLIENGKISKAVKNFRFTESPLFVLNSLEQLGEPVPVFSPGVPVIVPPVKARDFSFTSLVDAV
jgi:predicted Zn-dependent protease